MEGETKIRTPEGDTYVQFSTYAGAFSDSRSDSLENGRAPSTESSTTQSIFCADHDGDDRLNPVDSKKNGEDDISWLIGDHLIIFFVIMTVILFALILFAGAGASDFEL
eukprot:INCI4904.1.p3 GENE.INCI4904.1~~INCI4904.1.p3  ORF type:complete len:109 (-),score=17.56 INCI4904.1:659-985(-)